MTWLVATPKPNPSPSPSPNPNPNPNLNQVSGIYKLRSGIYKLRTVSVDRDQVTNLTNLGSRARVGDLEDEKERPEPRANGIPSRNGGTMCAERVRLMDDLDDDGQIER